MPSLLPCHHYKPKIKYYLIFVFQLVKKLISNQNIGYNKNTDSINVSKPQ